MSKKKKYTAKEKLEYHIDRAFKLNPNSMKFFYSCGFVDAAVIDFHSDRANVKKRYG